MRIFVIFILVIIIDYLLVIFLTQVTRKTEKHKNIVVLEILCNAHQDNELMIMLLLGLCASNGRDMASTAFSMFWLSHTIYF